MKSLFWTTALAGSLFATTALSGALERAAPNTTRILFEEGTYIEVSGALIFPSLSGEGDDFGGAFVAPGTDTGDLLSTFAQIGAAVKFDLTDRISGAVIFDQPNGVDTFYPGEFAPGSGFAGTNADYTSRQFSFIGAFDVTKNITAYAGVRLDSVDADAEFDFTPILSGGALGPYSIEAANDLGVGWLAGAAFQIPSIALRLAVTYYSNVDFSHDTLEIFEGSTPLLMTETNLSTPDSVTIDFQTGVAPNTLLFGSVRWVDWSTFSIEPPLFTGSLGVPLVDFDEDFYTFNLGLGYRFSDKWSAALTGTFEPETGQTLTTLGPIDGRIGFGLGATYQATENLRITGGFNYTSLSNAENFSGTEFDGGEAFGLGLRVGVSL
ncbi:MAG: outer membrane protein transport protein [Pseudomonadota bacterium]